MNYVDLKYKPKKTDLICEFYADPAAGYTIEKVADHIALESSIGTWTNVRTTNKALIKKLGAKVFSIKGKTLKIAYPSALFEGGNIPQILSSIAGNIFGMNSVDNLRLHDVYFPPIMDKTFPGPQFGVNGVREKFKIKKRPLVGTIVKPKVGLDSLQHAKVAFNAWSGGCDVVKDDENLSSQKFNPFKKRIVETLKMRDKAEKKTGETKGYMANVTAETNEMVSRAKFIAEQGGRYAMVDVLTVGWSGVQTLRNACEDLGLIIHGHRAMHGAITRNPKHGISMAVLAKCSRLAGVDQLHIGTAVGKMHGGAEETFALKQIVEDKIIKENAKQHVLAEEWGEIKPMFAVASGGLHPGHVEKLMSILGKDIIIQMGGGIHGHPLGTKAGAKAARDSVDAVMQDVRLNDYKSKELSMALAKWGYLK